jgi:cutinase
MPLSSLYRKRKPMAWVTASLAVLAAAGVTAALTLAQSGPRAVTSKPAALDITGLAGASPAASRAAFPAVVATSLPAAIRAAIGAAIPVPSQAASPAASTGTSCPSVNVVFARATGEPAGLGIVGTPFASAVSADLPGQTVTDYAVNYAADVSQTSAGPGATDMSQHITSLAAQCPDTKFVIGGYSQGASVTDIALGIRTVLGTGSAIPAALAPRIAAIVTFGNPLRLTGQTIASASPANAPKTDEFCNTGDPVCANGSDIVAHLEYASNGDPAQGAQFAAGQVLAAGG